MIATPLPHRLLLTAAMPWLHGTLYATILEAKDLPDDTNLGEQAARGVAAASLLNCNVRSMTLAARMCITASPTLRRHQCQDEDAGVRHQVWWHADEGAEVC